MAKGKTKYHHGDLRRMLVEAGVAFLKDNDAAGLSVRTLAKSLGVSEAAPYHHFADRQAFEHAVIGEGYAVLRARCEAAARSGGGLAGLFAAYVGFAADHPNLFRFMHRSGAARDPAHTDLYAQSTAAFDPLLAEVRRRAADAGITQGDRIGFLALMVWTQVHGLADIVLTDFLRLGDERDAFCRRAYAYIETSLGAALHDAGAPAPRPGRE
ncbi:AcrR family transcriptional regulator [Azospirillum fermentarium]|uniref:TetR/AcrR family transcriptional regulator n=1 Tax=Azospirillum fermentarium TaxID=1233114 RepID=UPI002227D745|nr:TetR/AcrR family transcriptional regulator [Azospirillum fermentarium]MCW2244634.1 AcrR family transcriptional regulator [Azospirillum fermentarium]